MTPAAVERSAANHQPAHAGELNHQMLAYIRALRRLPGIAWDTFKAKVALRIWWTLAHDVVGTKDFDTTLREFIDAFERCPDQDQAPGLPVDRTLANSATVQLPPRADGLPEKTKVLLRACVVLQRCRSDGTFFLSYEDAGRLMGRTSKRTVWKALNRLTDDDLIERVSKGSNLTHQANRYRVCFAPGPGLIMR
jgi:hypothetical protein